MRVWQARGCKEIKKEGHHGGRLSSRVVVVGDVGGACNVLVADKVVGNYADVVDREGGNFNVGGDVGGNVQHVDVEVLDKQNEGARQIPGVMKPPAVKMR
jgi:hypothetical protein